MKLLMVTEFYPPSRGGLEFHVEHLSRELAVRGHEVKVATLGSDDGSYRRGGIEVHRIRSSASRVRKLHANPAKPFHLPMPDPAVRRRLTAIVEAFAPDVVHAHNWMAASMPRMGPPMVMTFHDYAWSCAKRTMLTDRGSLCSGPSTMRCVRCASGQYGGVKAVGVVLGTQFGRQLVKADRYVCVSSAVKDRTARQLPDACAHVISNFIPTDFAARAAAADRSLHGAEKKLGRGRYVLFAGSPDLHKGIEVLLEAWRRNPPCDLVIAALKEPPFDVPRGVTVVSLCRDEVASVMMRAQLVVVPSVWPDPCPTVVLEAMALGRPVVASRVGGIAEMLRDGVEGLLVPPGDPDALLEACGKIVGDAGLRERMGRAGESRAKLYTAEEVVSALEEVYMSLGDKGGQRGS